MFGGDISLFPVRLIIGKFKKESDTDSSTDCPTDDDGENIS